MGQPTAGRVCVTGIGMRTPIGNCAAQTATSVRAGINRFREWPFLAVDFEVGGAGGLPIGSFIEGLQDEAWATKAEALATEPLEEALFDAALYQNADLTRAYRRNAIAGYLATPYPDRPGADGETVKSFFADAASHCVVDVSATRVSFFANSHAGGLMALNQAILDLENGEIDVGVVGGVDSLLETAFLMSELGRNKIKIEGEASGYIPAEAAAFLVLERDSDARRRGRSPYAIAGGVTQGREPKPFDGVDAPDAQALSEAIQGLLDKADSLRLADVFIDLNGERGRFVEWALAEGRCMHRLPRGWILHHPADCLGDAGAATGAMLLGLAASALREGQTRGNAALVCAMSEAGERACALLTHPDASGDGG